MMTLLRKKFVGGVTTTTTSRMITPGIAVAVVVLCSCVSSSYSFSVINTVTERTIVHRRQQSASRQKSISSSSLFALRSKNNKEQQQQQQQTGDELFNIFRSTTDIVGTNIRQIVLSTIVGVSAFVFSLGGNGGGGGIQIQPPMVWAATTTTTDTTEIVKCLFAKCPTQLAKCIIDPKCLANVICINTCKPDDIDCQIQCGDILDSPTIAEFNKCVLSDQLCVPQRPDEGLYPELRRDQTVAKFNTNLFNGRWYITAGQNKLFDIFPCQVHFFTETSPGKFFGQLNWRVTEPDGEFFTRDAVQEFYQDPNDPSHLINHDNEYLHYKDDWYIIDYEPDNNEQNIPPFAFVYYRGSNDAWDGYGGVVLYTRAAQFPVELYPRVRAAAEKIGYNFDTDFILTDNSCPAELSEGDKLILRQQFAGTLVLQTEQQIVAAATQFRGNAVNSIKAQKLFFDNRGGEATKAFNDLNLQQQQFEYEQSKK